MKNITKFALGIVLATGLSPAWCQTAYDPVTTDPIVADAQFPPAINSFTVTVGGATLNGRGLLAQGKGPNPTVLLTHGLPGNELNMDLAQTMRRAGWNVFMFHYRGSWGSGGQYSFTNVIDDTAAVLAYVRSKASDPAWRVDPARIVLVGHSVGGFAALNTAARDPQVKSVASMSGFDVASAGEVIGSTPAARTGFTNFIKTSTSLNVPDADAFVNQWVSSPAEWKFPTLASRLAQKNILLVAGAKDTVASVPRHHTPILQALKATPGANVTEVVLDTDHSYSDKRIALARAVLAWLAQQ